MNNQSTRFAVCLSLLVFLMILTRCAAPTPMKVVIQMMPAQEEYFRKTLIPAFEKKYNTKVEVISIDKVEQLPVLIKQADKTGGINLVKVPFEMTRVLAGRNLILPLDSIVSREEISQLKAEYFLMDLVKINQSYYYLPRKFETRMLVYLKSYVKEAVTKWDEFRPEIEASLKKQNGIGLPRDYILENDPSEWDYFDIFVVGFYWKSKEFDGKRTPRIAHRAKKYPGTALRLIDRAYQLGASPDDILRMDGNGVIDMFMWEALYTQEEIYNPRMYREGWSGADIWKGFQSGDVFLSFMTQIDAFFIHGAGTDAMPGFLENPEDMGVAIMPQGMSLLLNGDGSPMRVGKRGITTGGWWWGIPKNTPSKELSFQLAHFITNTENQIQGCSNFGMVPVRQDMLSELGLMFGGGWISNVFNVASQQLVENKFTMIPLVDEFDAVGRNYIEAFYDICINGNSGKGGVISFDHIKRTLWTNYVPTQKAILKDQFPGGRPENPEQPAVKEETKPPDTDPVQP